MRVLRRFFQFFFKVRNELLVFFIGMVVSGDIRRLYGEIVCSYHVEGKDGHYVASLSNQWTAISLSGHPLAYPFRLSAT